jgi:hypothetical protein
MKNNKRDGLFPIDLNEMNVFDFYDNHKNQKRIHLFNLLNRFNLVTPLENSFCITFDSLTKIGILLENVISPMKKNEKVINFFVNY